MGAGAEARGFPMDQIMEILMSHDIEYGVFFLTANDTKSMNWF